MACFTLERSLSRRGFRAQLECAETLLAHSFGCLLRAAQVESHASCFTTAPTIPCLTMTMLVLDGDVRSVNAWLAMAPSDLRRG